LRRPLCACAAAAAALALAVPAVADAAPTYLFSGTLVGQPDAGHPEDAATEASGAVLVLDTNADAVVRYANGSRTVVVPQPGDSLNEPNGIVTHANGWFDVTDDRVIRRYGPDGTSMTAINAVDGKPVSPRGIAAVGASGLVVADAANKRLLRYTGPPTGDLSSGWTVLARDLPGEPADVAVLADDRVLVSFPALSQLFLYRLADGTALAGPQPFDVPEDLLVQKQNVFVADGVNNRIRAFRGLAKRGVRIFPAPQYVPTTGKQGELAGPGCLFEAPAPASLGVCDRAAGGTAGVVDVYRLLTGQAALSPLRTAILEAGGTCSATFPAGSVVAMICKEFPNTKCLQGGITEISHGLGGGQLANLLLAAGGALAAAIQAGAEENGQPIVIKPSAIPCSELTRGFSAQRRRRGRLIRLEPGEPVILPIRSTARMRRSIRRALRKRRVVRRRLVITLTDTATGKRTRIRRTIVARKRRGRITVSVRG
jgi:hypothetical protein